MRVAALFVETEGCYFNLPNVDPWDVRRDARLYVGPHPVVAHPPCARWCRLAGLVEARWGHKRGEDGGCFAAALSAVRRFGGVLEHPAYSDAWKAFDLVRPEAPGWTRVGYSEWVCEVWQSAYGHLARKRTWLLYCSPGGKPPQEMRWERMPGVAQVGKFDRIKPTLSKKAASATPIPFRDALISLARSCR